MADLSPPLSWTFFQLPPDNLKNLKQNTVAVPCSKIIKLYLNKFILTRVFCDKTI
jgi:hypothetical protein